MSVNPFRFGRPVTESLLIGRESEANEVLGVLRESRNLAMVAPRGTGKSSLLRTVRKRCQDGGMDVAYVDLFPAINSRRFAELYASALTLEPTSTMEEMQAAVKHLVPSFVPRVTIAGEGQPALQLDLWDRARDIQMVLDRILDAPEQLREARSRPLVVVFDDFEDLVHTADTDLLRDLANSVRRHLKVSYVFVMRRDATVKRYFQEPKSPFYRLAEPVRLEVVPAAEMAVGIEKLFEEAGVRIEVDRVFELLAAAGHVPHYVQMLAHTLFEEARDDGRAREEHLKSALAHVLEGQSYFFKNRWDQLSLHQRNLVLAIAMGFTERLHSQKMVTRLGLGSPSTVSKNLKALAEREILQRNGNDIRFVDPFFGLWLQRRMM